jgi:ubiquinone/menaquinone biosynthesis C-methylase UbiE
MSSRVGSERQRREMLAGLQGRVLEVGAGDGRNFGLYPSEVSEVLAVEPEPYLRRLAARAAERAPVPVSVGEGTAEALPHEDGTFDAVVTSLVLCSVPDQASALSELGRVVTRGGELRFFEHVVAHGPVGRALQSRLDHWGIWPRLGGGCHLSRDTIAAIAAAGFDVESLQRFPPGLASLGIPFVLGSARRA